VLLELRPDDLLAGRYRITRHIGHGGFSQVFEALDQELDEKIALKVLVARGQKRRVVERMRREVRLARDLRHPNIVRVFDLVESDGLRFLVMELVQGKTLKALIEEQGPLPVPRMYELIRELTSAMAAVHTAGIVHRDLKPQNIMLSDQNRIKLLDFGLARASGLTGLTGSGEMLGTPDYISPEQVSGHQADSRSDIYSLGLIGWELLVGRPPFSGDKPLAVALQHVQSRVPPLTDALPLAPPAVSQLVLRMTDPEPARRPASASEVLAELERLQPRDLIAVDSARAGRRWLWLGTAALTAVVAVVGLIITPRPRPVPTGATDPWADGVVEMTVMSRPVTGVVGGELFLEALGEAVGERLADEQIRVRAVDPGFLDDLARLDLLGFEQLLELSLETELTPQGRIYRVQARLLEPASGRIIWQQAVADLTTLDFAGVEVVSSRLAESYRQLEQ
jgi:hypothetical protein